MLVAPITHAKACGKGREGKTEVTCLTWNFQNTQHPPVREDYGKYQKREFTVPACRQKEEKVRPLIFHIRSKGNPRAWEDTSQMTFDELRGARCFFCIAKKCMGRDSGRRGGKGLIRTRWDPLNFWIGGNKEEGCSISNLKKEIREPGLFYLAGARKNRTGGRPVSLMSVRGDRDSTPLA